MRVVSQRAVVVSGGPDPTDRSPAPRRLFSRSRAPPEPQRRAIRDRSRIATDVLVDADWAKAHLDDPSVRFVEVDVDTTAFEQSHIPGAVGWNWTSQLADGIRRDIAAPRGLQQAPQRSRIGPDTTIVLYGDNNNWFAAWAYWQLKLFGHRDVRILNGGRSSGSTTACR